MRRLLSFITSPTGLLYLYVVVTQIISGLYATRDVESPQWYIVLYPLGFLWIVGWWLQQDSRRHNFGWVYDMGFFLYIAWPFIMPYYLFKTRGVKAFIPILIFLAVFVGAFVIGIFFYTLWAF